MKVGVLPTTDENIAPLFFVDIDYFSGHYLPPPDLMADNTIVIMRDTIMKETYSVGFDPELRLWDAQPLIPDFHEDCWVFKVAARSSHEALTLGLGKMRTLIQQPSPDELALMHVIAREVGKRPRKPDDTLMVDIPTRLLGAAQALSDRGFFTLAHREEALVVLRSAGWKSITQHVKAVPYERDLGNALSA